jgi:hypothetical protein
MKYTHDLNVIVHPCFMLLDPRTIPCMRGQLFNLIMPLLQSCQLLFQETVLQIIRHRSTRTALGKQACMEMVATDRWDNNKLWMETNVHLCIVKTDMNIER